MLVKMRLGPLQLLIAISLIPLTTALQTDLLRINRFFYRVRTF